jgi:hypothetical protein
MAKKEKNVIERKFMNIKTKYKAGDYDIVEMDGLTCDLIAHLAQLTLNGVTDVEGVPIDLYKDRTWWIVENIGLLPEYRDEDIEFRWSMKLKTITIQMMMMWKLK